MDSVDQTAVRAPAAGWLLVFCFILTVLVPFTTIRSVWHVFSRITTLVGTRSFLIGSVYCLFFLGTSIYSAWAGLNLWLVRPHADKFAKRFLLVNLFAHLVYFALWYALSRSTSEWLLSSQLSTHVVGQLFATALWYSYLETSDRVRRTFSHPAASQI